jgi:hypothetical protein
MDNMRNIKNRIVERMPSIGRGQILSAEDAPARIDAGIELELGPSDDSKPLRTWPELVDPVHGRAGVSTSQPGALSGVPHRVRKCCRHARALILLLPASVRILARLHTN